MREASQVEHYRRGRGDGEGAPAENESYSVISSTHEDMLYLRDHTRYR
jgi:hypothetical protein